MFLLHVYHTHKNISKESSDFLIKYMMNVKGHAFCRMLDECYKYLKKEIT